MCGAPHTDIPAELEPCLSGLLLGKGCALPLRRVVEQCAHCCACASQTCGVNADCGYVRRLVRAAGSGWCTTCSICARFSQNLQQQIAGTAKDTAVPVAMGVTATAPAEIIAGQGSAIIYSIFCVSLFNIYHLVMLFCYSSHPPIPSLAAALAEALSRR